MVLYLVKRCLNITGAADSLSTYMAVEGKTRPDILPGANLVW